MLFLCADRYRIFILQQLLLHSILEIRILHCQQDACAAGGEVQAALQIAGVRLTQRAVAESLRRDISAQVAAIRAERSRLAAALAACPCIGQVYPSEANFLLVKTAAPDPLYRELIAAGVIVRNRSRIAGCEGCLRITVGRPEENDRMLETVKNFRP